MESNPNTSDVFTEEKINEIRRIMGADFGRMFPGHKPAKTEECSEIKPDTILVADKEKSLNDLNIINIQKLDEIKPEDVKETEKSFRKFYCANYNLKEEDIVYSEYNTESNFANDFPQNLVGCLLAAYSNNADVFLSPDDVWITVLQGIAQHLSILNASEIKKGSKDEEENLEKEKEIKKFIEISSLSLKWNVILQNLHEIMKSKIDKYDKLMLNDFSKSNALDIRVGLMNFMTPRRKYLQPTVFRRGVRNAIFIGFLDDWTALKKKIELVGERFEMKWWTDRLLEVIDQLITSFMGKPKADFWNTMVDTKDGLGCSGKKVKKNVELNGWILAFFPYDKFGNKIVKSSAIKLQNLVSEASFYVPLKFTPIGLQANYYVIISGFSGIRYEDSTYRPQISFVIVKNKELFEEFTK
jgi:hypothetical protein